MARAPIVDPDRRAVGAEQPVGAVAEDVEPGRQVQRRRQARARTRRAARGRRAAAPRAGAGGTARAPSRTRRRPRHAPRRRRRRRRRAVEADREQADALAAAHERQQQRRARVEPRREVRHLAVGVGDERRQPAVERVGDQRRFVRRRASRGRSRSASRPKPDVACSTPLRGLCWNSSEHEPPVTSSACWCRCGSRSFGASCCAPAATPAAARAAPWLAEPGRVPGVSRGHRFGFGGRRVMPRFYCDRSTAANCRRRSVAVTRLRPITAICTSGYGAERYNCVRPAPTRLSGGDPPSYVPAVVIC